MECQKERQTALEIARQCAPVLAGIKPSNLLIVEHTPASVIVDVLDGTGVCQKLLYESDTKSVWLIYRKSWLYELLGREDIADFFKACGYTQLTVLENVLECLSVRYVTYLDRRMDFPHEIGLLLGYPMADVKGYITNKGRDCLLNGYWKVYADADEAKKIFDVYTKVRQFIVGEISCGKSFCQIPGVC